MGIVLVWDDLVIGKTYDPAEMDQSPEIFRHLSRLVNELDFLVILLMIENGFKSVPIW